MLCSLPDHAPRMTIFPLRFLLPAFCFAWTAYAAAAGPPPGQLIAVRGHKLHLFCEGTGTPTVILHPGTGEFSFDWDLVQHRIAKVTRVCSWDRAGYAWSEMSPDFERFGAVAEDLHDLLLQAREAPPFLLVGHAFGALYVRDYQRRYNREVGGLVLVDPTPEEDTQGRMFGNTVTLIDMADHDLVTFPLHPFATNRTTPPPTLPSSSRLADPPFDRLPARLQRDRQWALEQFLDKLKNLTPAAELRIMESQRATFIELYNARHNPAASLGDLPVVLLTRGRNTTAEIRDMQDQLKRLSKATTSIVAEKCGTQIHLEDPALVTDAIRGLLHN